MEFAKENYKENVNPQVAQGRAWPPGLLNMGLEKIEMEKQLGMRVNPWREMWMGL